MNLYQHVTLCFDCLISYCLLWYMYKEYLVDARGVFSKIFPSTLSTHLKVVSSLNTVIPKLHLQSYLRTLLIHILGYYTHGTRVVPFFLLGLALTAVAIFFFLRPCFQYVWTGMEIRWTVWNSAVVKARGQRVLSLTTSQLLEALPTHPTNSWCVKADTVWINNKHLTLKAIGCSSFSLTLFSSGYSSREGPIVILNTILSIIPSL